MSQGVIPRRLWRFLRQILFAPDEALNGFDFQGWDPQAGDNNCEVLGLQNGSFCNQLCDSGGHD